MNTVSHPDGTAFSATGRHLVGGRVPASSIDTVIANELGKEQTFPVVSVQFPSSFVGDNLDRRVVPLTVGSVSTLSRALTRSGLYDSEAERDEVTALLSKEAHGIAQRSEYPDTMQGMSVQLDGLRTMLGAKLQDIFSVPGLQRAQPQFNYRARFATGTAVNAAFAVEAMKRNVVRCVSFSQGGFDTHNQNYKTQAQVQQELFDTVAVFLRTLDQNPHPTLTGRKLADTTHVLVISDFCPDPADQHGAGARPLPEQLGARHLPALPGQRRLRRQRQGAAPSQACQALQRRREGRRAARRPRDDARVHRGQPPNVHARRRGRARAPPHMRLLVFTVLLGCGVPAGVMTPETAQRLDVHPVEWNPRHEHLDAVTGALDLGGDVVVFTKTGTAVLTDGVANVSHDELATRWRLSFLLPTGAVRGSRRSTRTDASFVSALASASSRSPIATASRAKTECRG